MIEVAYKPTFVRQYTKLSKSLQIEVKEKIDLFRENPRHPYLKLHKLKGRLQGFWSFSVNYEYRIIVEFKKKGLALLLAVGNHDIYN